MSQRLNIPPRLAVKHAEQGIRGRESAQIVPDLIEPFELLEERVQYGDRFEEVIQAPQAPIHVPPFFSTDDNP